MCTSKTEIATGLKVQSTIHDWDDSVLIELRTPTKQQEPIYADRDYAWNRLSFSDARALRDHLNKMFDDYDGVEVPVKLTSQEAKHLKNAIHELSLVSVA